MPNAVTLARRCRPPRNRARRGTLGLPVLFCTLLAAVPSHAQSAPQDKFRITAQEKAACTSDAIRFCMHTFPDEDQLLACMKEKRDVLTAGCRIAFDAGVKRRRL